jgi:hypothetical protein
VGRTGRIVLAGVVLLLLLGVSFEPMTRLIANTCTRSSVGVWVLAAWLSLGGWIMAAWWLDRQNFRAYTLATLLPWLILIALTLQLLVGGGCNPE